MGADSTAIVQLLRLLGEICLVKVAVALFSQLVGDVEVPVLPEAQRRKQVLRLIGCRLGPIARPDRDATGHHDRNGQTEQHEARELAEIHVAATRERDSVL